MFSVWRRPLVIISLLCTVPAQPMPNGSQTESQLVQNNLRQEPHLNTRWGMLTKFSRVIRYQYETIRPNIKLSASQLAVRYLMENADKFGLDGNSSTLAITRQQSSPAGSHITVQQQFKGVPVYGTESVISINQQSDIVFIAGEFQRDMNQINNQCVLTTQDAIDAARGYLQAEDSEYVSPSVNFVVFPSKTLGNRYAYAVRLAMAKPRGDWIVLVDAQTSAILHVENRIMYQNGSDCSGLVWSPDPLRESGVYYGGDFTDPDGKDVDTDSLNANRHLVTLKDLRFSNNFYQLQGPFVHLTDIELPADTFAQATSPDQFNFLRSQQEFEHVMVYYHIDTAYRYLNSLGFDIPGLYEFKADPHGLNGEDNSYYMGGSANFCVFGEGGVDDAEDAAVILHEYAHAIQENIAQMTYLDETAALQEGCSDYWAASFSRSLTEFGWQHVFLWDAGIRSEDDSIGTFGRGRRCDLNLKYPQDYINQPAYRFQNGRIWSSALMNIWTDLGKEITDRLFIQAHYLWGTSPSFNAAAHAFLKADSVLYGGQHATILLDHFITYGFINPVEFFPQIIHKPLKDTELISEAHRVEAMVVPAQAPLDTTGLWVFWGFSGITEDSLKLRPDGEENLFYAEIPAAPVDTVFGYYIEALDTLGNLVRHPPAAPMELHEFRAGPDRSPPSVLHDPLGDQSIWRWPPSVRTHVTDNTSVAEVWVRFRTSQSAESDSFQLVPTAVENTYDGMFDISVDSITINDSVSYQIVAYDQALSRNKTVLPKTSFFVFKIIGGGGEIAYDLEADDGGFNATGDWAWGVPASGPYSAYSGSRLWATNPEGNYSMGPLQSSLTIPQIDLSPFNHVTLSFRHWYNFEQAFDGGNIKVSSDSGQNWQIVYPILGYDTQLSTDNQNPLAGEEAFSGYSAGWRLEKINLDGFIGKNVLIRFEMGADQSKTSDGWYIDDILISESLAALEAPSNLQVLENRGMVILAWGPVQTRPDELATVEEGFSAGQDQNLLYRIYRNTHNQPFSAIDSTNQQVFTDSAVIAGQTYRYFVTSVMNLLESEPSDTVAATVQAVVFIGDRDGLPESYMLGQNYPNPFNPQTNIQFQLPQSTHTSLVVYTIDGRKVRSLIDSPLAAGFYEIVWDGCDNYGQQVSSGVYFYRIQSKSYTKTRKMVLMR